MTKIRDQEQVVDAAAKIFAEKGFEAARLEDIATELGVLQGSLYYHITSKADLLFLVQRRRLESILEQVERVVATDLPPDEKLRMALLQHLRHLERYHPESSQWFTEPASSRASTEGREYTRELNRRYTEIWSTVVREGLERQAVRPELDADVVARALLGMCNWVPRWYRKDGAHSIDEIGEMIVTMVWNGLAADGEMSTYHPQT